MKKLTISVWPALLAKLEKQGAELDMTLPEFIRFGLVEIARRPASAMQEDSTWSTEEVDQPTLQVECKRNPSGGQEEGRGGTIGGLGGSGSSKEPPSNPPADFSRFWSVYPRKIAKGAALRAWKKTAKARPPLDVVIQAVTAAKASAKWRERGGEFIPHPATWLNQGRWDDDPAALNAGGGAPSDFAEYGPFAGLAQKGFS